MDISAPDSGENPKNRITRDDTGTLRHRTRRRLAIFSIFGVAVSAVVWQSSGVAQPAPNSSPTAAKHRMSAEAVPVLNPKLAPLANTKSAPSPDAPTSSKSSERAPDSRRIAKDPGRTAKGQVGKSSTPDTWPAESRAQKIREIEKSAVLNFVDTSVDISPGKQKSDVMPVVPDFTDIATGSAEGELQAQFAEAAQNGWTQTGRIRIMGDPKVQSLTKTKIPTRRIFACIDSSTVEVQEADGHVVTPAAAPGTKTALNIFDVQERDGQWLVVDHFFPNNPEC